MSPFNYFWDTYYIVRLNFPSLQKKSFKHSSRLWSSSLSWKTSRDHPSSRFSYYSTYCTYIIYYIFIVSRIPAAIIIYQHNNTLVLVIMIEIRVIRHVVGLVASSDKPVPTYSKNTVAVTVVVVFGRGWRGRTGARFLFHSLSTGFRTLPPPRIRLVGIN